MNQYEIDYKQGYDKANDEWLEKIDKIRAEIEEERNTWDKLEGANHYYSYNKCLEIIDKYKSESEEKE